MKNYLGISKVLKLENVMPYERRPREMHDAKCGDCGKDCQVPFEPRNDKPVYCNDCFQDHKPERNDRGGGRFGRDRPPREMHKVTCGDCGNECEVPFKPKDARPVYCNDCFQNHKPERNDRGPVSYTHLTLPTKA